MQITPTPLEITICRADEVVEKMNAAHNTPYHAVISFEHPCGEEVSASLGRAPRLGDILGGDWHDRQRIIVCYDVERPMQNSVTGKIYNPPGFQEILDGIEHVERFRPEQGVMRLLIHCRSGRARSTAFAMILLSAYEGLSDDSVIAKIKEIRPIAAPNRAIVICGGILIGRGSDLASAMDRDEQITLLRERAEISRARQVESGGVETLKL